MQREVVNIYIDNRLIEGAEADASTIGLYRAFRVLTLVGHGSISHSRSGIQSLSFLVRPQEFSIMNTPTMPQNPLLAGVSDPGARRILQGSTSDLARATRPPFLGNGHSPVQWTGSDWEQMEANREDLLDMPAARAQFDRDRYLLDGYAVFSGIVLPQALEAWKAALQYGQHLNDTLLQADWSEIDWHGLGRRPPEETVAAEALERALGGSQSVPQKTDAAGVRTLRQHSVFAEYFPAGHLPFMMNVVTHPHMLELQRMCLGCDDIFFDQSFCRGRPGILAGRGTATRSAPATTEAASPGRPSMMPRRTPL